MSQLGTTFDFVGGTGSVPAGAVLVVPLIAKPKPPMETVAQADKLCDGALSQLIAAKALGDEVAQLAHTTAARGCRRVLAVSLGEASKIKPHLLRKAAMAAARWLIAENVTQSVLWLDGMAASGVENAAAEWATGMAFAGFRFEKYKKPEKKPAPAKIKVAVRGREAGAAKRALPEIREALAVMDGVNYTRALAYTPANVINPATLAVEAKRLARQYKLKCTVLEGQKLKQLKMGGLVGVGQGAAQSSRLIRLDYKGAPNVRKTLVVVGKAITFDSGGYCLKPPAGLPSGKVDKTGGCVVLGVLVAAAQLKLKCNIVGLVAAAENMISAQAYRAGDIIEMSNGKTVEVTNTDAEGRLVLADALVYAQKHCNPTTIVDVATLTGGVVVALGSVCAGFMSNDDNLAAALEEAGRRTHERVWRLPLWDDYRELMKSTCADILNSAEKREAHPIQGAIFLKEFVEDKTPWAHIDIAGARASNDGGDLPTGYGVRLLIELLRRHLNR